MIEITVKEFVIYCSLEEENSYEIIEPIFIIKIDDFKIKFRFRKDLSLYKKWKKINDHIKNNWSYDVRARVNQANFEMSNLRIGGGFIKFNIYDRDNFPVNKIIFNTFRVLKLKYL